MRTLIYFLSSLAKAASFFSLGCMMLLSLHTHAQIITTIAGGGSAGLGDGGPALSCELSFPNSIAIDAAGNLYIADQGNNRIRKVNTAGIITTIAGTGVAGYSGDGSPATDAKISGPSGIAVDGSGNVYISDNYNHRIRKVNTAGIISTVAGTGIIGYNGDGIQATAATVYSPHGIAVDGSGNLYICDVLNNRLRKVNSSGVITTIAGTGTIIYGGDGGQASVTSIGQPYGVATDKYGNVFFANLTAHRICKINTSGIIATIAGTGTGSYNGDNIPATSAELKEPFDVAVDGNGKVYFSDYLNYRIRSVNTSGIITTVAGTGMSGFSGDGDLPTLAEIGGVTGIALDTKDNLYLADRKNFLIRYIKNTVSVKTINELVELVNVYPNPSITGNFTVQALSGSDYVIQVTVADVTGRTIKEISTATNKPAEISLDVPNGIYYVSVTTDEGSGKVMRKIVIQR